MERNWSVNNELGACRHAKYIFYFHAGHTNDSLKRVCLVQVHNGIQDTENSYDDNPSIYV